MTSCNNAMLNYYSNLDIYYNNKINQYSTQLGYKTQYEGLKNELNAFNTFNNSAANISVPTSVYVPTSTIQNIANTTSAKYASGYYLDPNNYETMIGLYEPFTYSQYTYPDIQISQPVPVTELPVTRSSPAASAKIYYYKANPSCMFARGSPECTPLGPQYTQTGFSNAANVYQSFYSAVSSDFQFNPGSPQNAAFVTNMHYAPNVYYCGAGGLSNRCSDCSKSAPATI